MNCENLIIHNENTTRKDLIESHNKAINRITLTRFFKMYVMEFMEVKQAKLGSAILKMFEIKHTQTTTNLITFEPIEEEI